jgi:uncharacterized protein YmfQ (DUF2313 family)
MPHDADQYRQQLKALLPPGWVFTRERGRVLDGVLDGLAQELARIEARGADLIDAALPDTTLEMLPDWERLLGLPDECLPRDSTLQARREAVLAKLVGQGGQDAAYYVDLARVLGYAGGWVEEYRPFLAVSPCIDPLNTDPWCFVWVLHVPRLPPGAGANDRALECLVNRYRPAHTFVRFVYAEHYYVLPDYVAADYFEEAP